MTEETRVVHVPNIPGPAFTIKDLDLKTAAVVSDALAYYDLFLLEHGYRQDYSNISDVQQKDEEGWYSVDEYDLEGYGVEFESIGSE